MCSRAEIMHHPSRAARHASVLTPRFRRSNASALITTTSAGIGWRPNNVESRAISAKLSFTCGSTTSKSIRCRRASDDFFPKVAAELLRRPQVHLAVAKQLRKLDLDAGHVQRSRAGIRFEVPPGGR
jgi:hypothetical protein